MTTCSRVFLEKLISSSASQELRRVLCKPKFHYCFLRSPSLAPHRNQDKSNPGPPNGRPIRK